MPSSKSPIICLMGPTASGKTQLAVTLIQHFPMEIISVDSAMVYRGMDIGTAKPSADILKIAPHRLIDFQDPATPYSAAHFREDALREIADIIAQEKIPLLVGGTMLYFRALQQGIAEMPGADAILRAKISREGIELGWPILHERLQKIDPAAASRIHPHDSQRIQRALEVYELTGKAISQLQQNNMADLNEFNVLNIAVAPLEREILHARIAQRFQQMLAEGFVEEVRELFKRSDLNEESSSIRSVGYRQVWQYLSNQLTYEEMQEKAVIATRQLAKRQLTWLRHWQQPIKWFDSEDVELTNKIIQHLKKNL